METRAKAQKKLPDSHVPRPMCTTKAARAWGRRGVAPLEGGLASQRGPRHHSVRSGLPCGAPQYGRDRMGSRHDRSTKQDLWIPLVAIVLERSSRTTTRRRRETLPRIRSDAAGQNARNRRTSPNFTAATCPQSFFIVMIATPRFVQNCSVCSAEIGMYSHRMKLELCPEVDSTPRRNDSLYTGAG